MGSSSPLSQTLMILAVALSCCHHQQAAAHKKYDSSKFCQTADDKALCEQMVSGAQTLHDASEKAIKETMDYAKKIEKEGDAVIEDDKALKDLPPKSRKAIIDVCKDSYETAVEDLDRSLKALIEHDKGTLMTRLSAALESDCEDAVEEFGVQFPMKKDMKRFNAELDSTLAVVTQQ